MACKKHPNYRAIRPPVANCDDCWKLWYERHPNWKKVAKVPKKKAKTKKCGCD